MASWIKKYFHCLSFFRLGVNSQRPSREKLSFMFYISLHQSVPLSYLASCNKIHAPKESFPPWSLVCSCLPKPESPLRELTELSLTKDKSHLVCFCLAPALLMTFPMVLAGSASSILFPFWTNSSPKMLFSFGQLDIALSIKDFCSLPCFSYKFFLHLTKSTPFLSSYETERVQVCYRRESH